jgi:PhnB protein
MHLNPYLQFAGNCAEAFAFYQSVLGGELTIMRYRETPMAAQCGPDFQDKTAHARIAGDGLMLMGSDSMPSHYQKPQGFTVTINIEAPAAAEALYAKLVTGGTPTMPIQETFWAQRFGMLIDKFGIPWMVNCEKAR